MTKIICLLGDELSPELEAQLAKLDGEDVQIHLVTYVVGDENFCPPMVLSILEEAGGELGDSLVFCSDMKKLCEVISCIYGRIFQEILWLESDNPLEYWVDEFYQMLLDNPYDSSTDFTQYGVEHSQGETKWAVYYYIEDTYFVFEPIAGDKIAITSEGIKKIEPEREQICYMYPFFEKELDILCKNSPDQVDEEYKIFCTQVIIMNLQKMEDTYSKNHLQFRMFMLALEDSYHNKGEEEVHFKLLASSFLACVTEESKYYDYAYKIILENQNTLTIYNKYYLWRQLRRYSLRRPKLKEMMGYSAKIYDVLCENYTQECKEYLSPIPKEERDKDFVMVIGIQFLSEFHAPTRTVLERCRTLVKEMGKRVLFVNTREQITTLGAMHIYDGEAGNVVTEYDSLTQFTYKDCTFEFYQCKGLMPEFEETKKVLSMIRKQKPYMVFAMGAGSMVTELAANIVPVINFPMAFSTIINRKNQFTSLGKKLSEEEKKSLTERGFLLDSIIEGIFTFDIKEQKSHFTREDFGLPQDKFLLLIVGLRLHAEVDERFIQYMSQLYENGIHLVFAGYFENYDKICNSNLRFKEHSTFIGYQKDILAIQEVIDLYVNPERLGGGFSIAEAFAKGKPGITTTYGDVGATAGPEFSVANYEEMIPIIRRYIDDGEFYRQMSAKALERVEILTDSATALRHIIDETEARKMFF